MLWLRTYGESGEVVDNLPWKLGLDGAIEEGYYLVEPPSDAAWFEVYSEDYEERLWNSLHDAKPDELLFW